MEFVYKHWRNSQLEKPKPGDIDVGDECWRWNMLVTTIRCWWRIWSFGHQHPLSFYIKVGLIHQKRGVVIAIAIFAKCPHYGPTTDKIDESDVSAFMSVFWRMILQSTVSTVLLLLKYFLVHFNDFRIWIRSISSLNTKTTHDN